MLERSKITLDSKIPGIDKLARYSSAELFEIVLNKDEAQMKKLLEEFVRHLAHEASIEINEEVLFLFLEHFKFFSNCDEYISFVEEVKGKSVGSLQKFLWKKKNKGETRARSVNLLRVNSNQDFDYRKPFIVSPYIYVPTNYLFLFAEKGRQKIAMVLIQTLWFAAERFFNVEELENERAKNQRALQAARFLVVQRLRE